MSIDKPRSRKDIDDEMHEREYDQKERLEDSEKVVEDKKIEAETARKLNLTGTSEGTEEVKEEITEAADETDQEFHEQKEELEKEVFEKAREFEDEMQERMKSSEQDYSEIDQIISQIDTKKAADKLDDAASAVNNDRAYLEKTHDEQELNRIEGEEEISEQEEEIKETEVTFKDKKSDSDNEK